MLLSFATNALLNLCDAKLTRVLRRLRRVRTGYAYQPPALGTYRTHRAACPRAPRTVRTGYAYRPRALGTYRVLWQPRRALSDLLKGDANADFNAFCQQAANNTFPLVSHIVRGL